MLQAEAKLYQNVHLLSLDTDAEHVQQTAKRMSWQLADRLRADRMTALDTPVISEEILEEHREELPRSWWQRLLRRPRKYVTTLPAMLRLEIKVTAIPTWAAQ